MKSSKFRYEVTDSHPYLDESYNYPKFRKGDVVWYLDENSDSSWKEFHNDRYIISRMVILNGDPADDDCGWAYHVATVEEFEDEEFDDKNCEYIYQTNLFYKLIELKEAVKYRCEKRINELKENIKSIKAQIKHAEAHKSDPQEHREEQIDSVIDG